MLDVEVVPELALRHNKWEFTLGMPIQQLIDILHKQDQLIKSVDFWYNEKVIEIFDLSVIALRYWSNYFNSSSVLPTLQEVMQIFGSTKAITPGASDGEYYLSYRGITFVLTGSRDSNVNTNLPVTNISESESNLLVTRLFIYLGNNLSQSKIPIEMPGNCYMQNVFLERLEVQRFASSTDKLIFHLTVRELDVNPNYEPQICRFKRCLSFGDMVQDVLSALGSPSRVFYKTEDKMKIHLPQPHRLEQRRQSDYFFNYFTLGTDILFDARTHKVMKFVLHTNQPGEYTFNTYYRCLFEIPIDTSTTKNGSSLQAEHSQFLITPFTKWSEIRTQLQSLQLDMDPVVIYRESKPANNLFGPTHAYGYQDFIFEIIPDSECISSVTFYAPVQSF